MKFDDRIVLGFPTLTSTFEMAAMTLFRAEKCHHPVSAHAASVPRLCSSVRQFLTVVSSYCCCYL